MWFGFSFFLLPFLQSQFFIFYFIFFTVLCKEWKKGPAAPQIWMLRIVVKWRQTDDCDYSTDREAPLLSCGPLAFNEFWCTALSSFPISTGETQNKTNHYYVWWGGMWIKWGVGKTIWVGVFLLGSRGGVIDSRREGLAVLFIPLRN